MTEPRHPAFDSEEQEILSHITADEDPTLQLPSPEATAPAAAPVVEATAAPAAPAASTETTPVVEAPAAEQPQGDKTAALRAARRSERQLRSEVQRLRDELDQAKQGKAPVSTEITEDELETLRQDFPLQHKLMVRQRELESQIAAMRPAPAATADFQPPVYDPDIQEQIDSVPDLLAWQHDPAAQDKFARAVEYDEALKHDPDWKGKPVAERFAEAAKRTKRAFGMDSQAPAHNRQDPAAVIAAAQSTGPKGISDFKGGASASAPAIDYSRMSDEEIMARLPATD